MDPKPLDTTERKVRSTILSAAAKAHGVSFDRSCSNCREPEGDHDDDGKCPTGSTYYARRRAGQ